jgi:hypothetical protein
MTQLKGLALAATIMLVTACSSGPVFEASDNVATVNISQFILDAPRKRDAADEYEVARTLHRYISHRFNKLRVRKELHFKVTLIEFRLKASVFSHGVSHMKVHVTVLDRGIPIKEFEAATDTGYKKTKAVRVMSKEIAIRIYSDIKDLL